MSLPSAVLLLNARARRAAMPGLADLLRGALARRWTLEVRVPRDAMETEDLARAAAADGAGLVIAGGGDGTTNVVANGLAGTGVSLGILPLGSANDLARELGLPPDVPGAARRLAEGEPRALDLVTVNGRAFCTVGGVALVADAARSAARIKAAHPLLRRAADAIGGGIYRVTATAHLLAPRDLAAPTRLAWRDPESGAERTLEVDAHAVFVTNHRTLGGGMVLPVDASARDGVFELSVVSRRARLSLLANFARLSAGARIPPGVLETVRATRAVIHTARDDVFVADGEPMASGREFVLAMRAGALSVVC